MGQSLAVLLSKESVGVRIRRARDEAGLTQVQLAARIGLQGPQQVSRYETGVSEAPAPRLRQIAEETGKTLAFFFHGEEEPSRVVPFPGQDHQPARPEQVEALHNLVREQMNLVETLPSHLEKVDDQLEGIAATLSAIDERLGSLDAQLKRLIALEPRKSKSPRRGSSS
jgi:transcriptional regulator with XRE-family HTH domain